MGVLDRLPRNNPRATLDAFGSLLDPEFLTTVPIGILGDC
jgi:hypothetical protein